MGECPVWWGDGCGRHARQRQETQWPGAEAFPPPGGPPRCGFTFVEGAHLLWGARILHASEAGRLPALRMCPAALRRAACPPPRWVQPLCHSLLLLPFDGQRGEGPGRTLYLCYNLWRGLRSVLPGAVQRSLHP
jgi:hypothetical protein